MNRNARQGITTGCYSSEVVLLGAALGAGNPDTDSGGREAS